MCRRNVPSLVCPSHLSDAEGHHFMSVLIAELRKVSQFYSDKASELEVRSAQARLFASVHIPHLTPLILGCAGLPPPWEWRRHSFVFAELRGAGAASCVRSGAH